MTAAKVVNFPRQRAAEAAPVYKLRAMQRVRELTAEGELLLRDMVVFVYITEIIDKETGVAVVGRSTIAERVGCSRVTVTRSLRRLFDAGVLEHERRGMGKRCFANAYRIADVRSEMNRDRSVDEPAPVHECTTFARGFEIPSPDCLDPGGRGPGHDQAQQNDEEAKAVEETWIDLGEWLATEGEYARRGSGPGEAYKLAKADLERWRGEKGDRAILQAIRRAKRLGLTGNSLIDFLENTYPDK